MIDYTKLPALLTIVQATEIMGVSRDYVYKALQNNELPTHTIRGKRWILRDPLLRKLGVLGEEEMFLTPSTASVQLIYQRLEDISTTLDSVKQLLERKTYHLDIKKS